MIRRSKLFVLLSVIVAMFGVMMPASAQSTLVYGSGATGAFSATAPLAFYTFQGQANDLVSILVLGLTPGMQPSIVLNNMSQQAIANSTNDPFSAGSSTARLSAQLPSDGIYTIIVTPANGVPGDYAIRLDGSQVASESTVDTDNPSNSPVVATGNTVFNVAGNPDATQVASISTNTVGFAFSALLQDAGTTLAIVAGNDLMPAFVTIPASSSTFKIIVTSATGIDGEVSLSLGSGPSTSADDSGNDDSGDDVVEPVVTEEVEPADGTEEATSESETSSTPTPSPTQQAVTSSTATYTPTAEQQQQQINATSTRTPSPTPTTQQQVNPTSTYTPTTQQLVNPTATYTPSYTPTYTATATTQQATATYTPSYTPTIPPVQIAPEDQRSYAFNMQLDTTASITEFVSYPGGDHEDRVVYDVRGMNPNVAFSGGRARLILAVSCFGTNTDQVQFFTGGQTYSCGQTITDKEVTNDSNNGSIVITAIGGEGTYVQWVVTGTVTRIN